MYSLVIASCPLYTLKNLVIASQWRKTKLHISYLNFNILTDIPVSDIIELNMTEIGSVDFGDNNVFEFDF
jgi:hypothetical protein